ncbi:MAG TPA: sulfurtransferase-like selenium metabolism protein YedF [Bacteroidales bacterium]|nr:sulfurtransferase-like selenium metabolism protein YedF [Bacteroidales bacterium]
MKLVDTRGQKCPLPIIEARKAIRETSAGETFTLITDSKTSFSNVSRYLSDNRIKFTVSEKDGLWTFAITNETGSGVLTSAENYCEPEIPGHQKGNYAVAVTSDTMGSGDDILGKKLIKSFFVSVSCLDVLPDVMVFYNSGVKLAVKDSDVIDLLREIEGKGVEIILCSTCVDHFNLAGSLGAGKTGDMFQILQKLSSAGNVIRP